MLVVKNAAAFTARYGSGLPVAGAFANATGLSNGGEQITLTGPGGVMIRSFAYDDLPGTWPLPPDGFGPSLQLANPAANPNPALGASWRASFDIGGNPGNAETAMTYARWRTRYFDPADPNFSAVSDPLADSDADGFSNLAEFALATNPAAKDAVPAVGTAWESAGGQQFLTLTYTRRPSSSGFTITAEQAADISTWTPAPITLLSSIPNPDGTFTETVRLENSAAANRSFYRLKIAAP
jgi:hypothetical protein